MTHEGQRMGNAAWLAVPREGRTMLRLLVCIYPCEGVYATTGCIKHHHLVGIPEDALPPLVLTTHDAGV